MTPKEAYEKFEAGLLNQLPADQPDFIALLAKENVISGEAKKKINVRLGNRLGCAAVILTEIEESVPKCGKKFYKLLSIMKQYSHGMKILAEEIENNLDPGMQICTHVRFESRKGNVL